MSSGQVPGVSFAILAVDAVVCALKDDEVVVRITPAHNNSPFDGSPVLPGGLIRPEEDAESAVRRILREKAIITSSVVHLEQLYTFSRIDRDPRRRVVAVAYLGLVSWEALSPEDQSERDGVQWVSLRMVQHLGYDHDEIVRVAVARLRSRIRYTTLISRLLPASFTLTALERAYAVVLGSALDKRNFRKKILKLGVVRPVQGKRTQGQFRPAQLYAFVSDDVSEIEIL